MSVKYPSNLFLHKAKLPVVIQQDIVNENTLKRFARKLSIESSSVSNKSTIIYWHKLHFCMIIVPIYKTCKYFVNQLILTLGILTNRFFLIINFLMCKNSHVVLIFIVFFSIYVLSCHVLQQRNGYNNRKFITHAIETGIF